jgi:dTDP-4-amino-4,6-dideoxygalactose transaminase
MPVPLLDVNAQNLPLEKELNDAFLRVLRSGQFIMGPDVAAFEAEAAACLGAKHALGVSSGTDALLLALMALEIGPGDEVLCPSFTFFATAGSIARVGATPVFVDSDLATFNIDVADAARKVTPRTKAIMPVHLFGQCADMDAVKALAAAHGLRVIEDAAQSFGATYKGRQSGTMGDFGAYSFFPSKNLGGLGDAGMLVTNDDALAERARILRVHGAQPKYYHKFIGGNFRIDTVQAAFLRVKLKRLETYNRARRGNAEFYGHELASLAAPGPGAPLVLPRESRAGEHIWNQYTIRVPGPASRDALRSHLQARGIGTEIYYPVPLHAQECFARLASPCWRARS